MLRSPTVTDTADTLALQVKAIERPDDSKGVAVKIADTLLKMTAIMVNLIGLGIHARDFVIEGIMSKVAINLSIFAIFGVAAGIASRNMTSLRNQVVALQALQVDYG